MHRQYSAILAVAAAVTMLFAFYPLSAQSSADPGSTVRNVFGPDVGMGANQCRGACGGGCPRSCDVRVFFECEGATRLRRVEAFSCGTHPGCREHDDCLDACMLDNPDSEQCGSQCDASAMQKYGLDSMAWMMGKGPYDGRIVFEYTRQAPSALEPAYRCPEGAERQCGDSTGCVAANGARVDPVFDSYPAGRSGAMQVSALRTGPLCAGKSDRVCEPAQTIRVTGGESCSGGRCTRFGMEFDYRNADPSLPLECATSTRGGDDDFVGDLLKLGADANVSRSGGKDAGGDTGGQQDGMKALLGAFSKVLASADSPEDVDVSIAPLDENGNPIESQRVGSSAGSAPPPIPRTIALPAASGHLFVPMYQLADNWKPGTVKTRRITCRHNGDPVLETVVQLQ